MKILKFPKPSKKVVLLLLLCIVVATIPLTIYLVQQQQIFQQQAWFTKQSATAVCDPTEGSIISVTFSNTESLQPATTMDVVALDQQSGKSVNMGSIKGGETKTNKIQTEKDSLKAGNIIFSLKWTDGHAGTDTRSATYKAVEKCTSSGPFCPAGADKNKGLCKWDMLEGATGYNVIVTELASEKVIKSESVSSTTTQSAFPMELGKSYQCSVTPINACGKGFETQSPEKTCTAPTVTPSPSPTVPVCPAEPNKQGLCKWDSLEGANGYKVTVKDVESGDVIKSETVKDTKLNFTADHTKTYQCSVIAINACSETKPVESPPTTCAVPSPSIPQLSETPIPSVTKTPTATLAPTVTSRPTSLPTPSPLVVVRINPTTPPRVIQQPIQRQQPPQSQPQPQQPVQPAQQQIQPTQPPITPVPTVKPTGTFSTTLILFGTSAILLLVGGIFLFLI